MGSNETKLKTKETPKWPIGCPLWQVQSSNQQHLLKIGDTPWSSQKGNLNGICQNQKCSWSSHQKMSLRIGPTPTIVGNMEEKSADFFGCF